MPDPSGLTRPGSEPAASGCGFSVQEGVKTENEHIGLRVAGQDGSVVRFRIKRHSRLNKLMKSYCCPQGLSMRHIVFLFDGQPIKENDTPAELEMEHKDTIDVYKQQTGAKRVLRHSIFWRTV